MYQVGVNITCLVLSLCISAPTFAVTSKVKVPMGTRVYIATKQKLVGKKDQVRVGQFVSSQIWKDVVIDNRVVIAAGTAALVRVDSLKTRKIAGVKGRMSLGALETESVGGKTVQLTGGYMKAGHGKIVLTSVLAGLLLLPLIFMRGKAAVLPIGTVFDAYTGTVIEVEIDDELSPPVLNLSSVLADLTVEVLYEKLEETDKPKVFDFLITAPKDASSEFVIDKINGDPTDPISLKILSREEDGEEAVIRASVGIKTLAKRFKKGINRFDVTCSNQEERLRTEVVF